MLAGQAGGAGSIPAIWSQNSIRVRCFGCMPVFQTDGVGSIPATRTIEYSFVAQRERKCLLSTGLWVRLPPGLLL
jgi:hypothetical protein